MRSIWTFCAALIPGVGQMYQGYMKRGVSMMVMFFGVIAISSVLYIDIFMLVLPIIWAYSFFDTYNISHLTPEKRDSNKDAFLFNMIDFNWIKAKKTFNGSKWFGIGTICLGVFLLYNNIIADVLRDFIIEMMGYDWVGYVMRFIPSIVVALLLIVLGIHMVRGSKKQAAGEDDIVEYNGGEK